MNAPDRPTREQAAHPGSRMVGESYKDHSARAFGMLRAAEVDLAEARAEVRALRAELEALDDAAAAAVTVSGRRWAAHATILRREREEAREALGLEMGMRTAAVDELEALRRRLWALLDSDQLSDDDTVDRLRAALAARTPQPAEDRCPSCDHRRGFHSEPGCWHAVTTGTPGKPLNCPCTVVDWPAPLPTVSDGEDETSRAVSRLMFDARPVDHAAEQVAVRTVDLARVLNEFIQYAAAGINKPRQEGP